MAFHLINIASWVCLLNWPWGSLLLPALVVLALSHLLMPFWTAWRRGGFVGGPLLMLVIDGAFLYAAWTGECWGELTVVFAPVMGALALISLGYGAAVMALLSRSRARK